MKIVQLTFGKEALVDDEDYEFLMQWSWGFEPRENTGYARRKFYGRTVYMHQLVAKRSGLIVKNDVDHCDGNGLDNRRENLRPATRSQNNANQCLSRRNKSGYKGVYWSSAAQKWAAQLARKYLGLFEDPCEAARAYNEAATAQFGEFAKLNSV